MADVPSLPKVLTEQWPFLKAAAQLPLQVLEPLPLRQGTVELPEQQLRGRHRPARNAYAWPVLLLKVELEGEGERTTRDGEPVQLALHSLQGKGKEAA